MNKILSTRYKITDELRCIRFFHFLHNIILLSVILDSIRVYVCLLYGDEWQVIEFVMELCGCSDITLDEEPILVECVEKLNPFDWISIDSPSLLVARVHPPTRRASFDA